MLQANRAAYGFSLIPMVVDPGIRRLFSHSAIRKENLSLFDCFPTPPAQSQTRVNANSLLYRGHSDQA